MLQPTIAGLSHAWSSLFQEAEAAGNELGELLAFEHLRRDNVAIGLVAIDYHILQVLHGVDVVDLRQRVIALSPRAQGASNQSQQCHGKSL